MIMPTNTPEDRPLRLRRHEAALAYGCRDLRMPGFDVLKERQQNDVILDTTVMC